MFRQLLFFVLFSSVAYAQTSGSHQDYRLNIKRTAEAINIDGMLEESDWTTAQTASDFYLNFPFDTSFVSSKYQTEVKLLFDDHFIYVAAKCFQPRSEIIVSSLKRDFESGQSDEFVVNFDTFSDKLNGFHFAVNPYGVQREGLILEGNEVSTFWDNKWVVQTRIYDDYWTAEFAIPFKTLRYKMNETQAVWNINFIRQTIKSNLISTWVPVPRFFDPGKLAYSGKLVWVESPPHPGTNVSLIPFVTASSFRDNPRDYDDLKPKNPVKETKLGYGLDAKIGVTSSLNLDITLNPDFSQVEVDRQVTNLSRFELFFPERRQFFLENNDLFGQFGFPSTRPFFSRRVGIAQHPQTGMTVGVPIIGGARLSGKLDQNWRIGLMNMQTRKLDFGDGDIFPASNYSVGVVQRKILKRSTIGGVFINKQNQISGLKDPQKDNFQPWNRVGGLELNLNSNDGRFEVETYYHQSFDPDPKKDASSFGHFMGYSHPNAQLFLGVFRIGENFRPEAGFVPRTGIWQIFRPITFTIYPKNPTIATKINSFELGFLGEDAINFEGKVYDSNTDFFFSLLTNDRAQLGFSYGINFTHLFYPYDPTNADENPNPQFRENVIPLPLGDYSYHNFGFNYSSSLKRPLFGSFEISKGQYFNGKGDFINMELNYRLQPYGILAIETDYSNIQLSPPYNSASYWLIGPRAEMAFHKNLFTSLFVQYNSQINNANINARLQWRFKPVSDLFLVYTENNFAESIPNYGVKAWTPKDRAITLKMTYWLNL